jgi:AcrR family transcriptional regulator
MYIHLEHDSSVDPRVLRTREQLINSFAKLLVEHKSIRKVSVQSITKLAGVNRVTFYAHFTDKYELLDVWARVMFRQSVVEMLPNNAQLDRESLTLLIHSTLDFFTMRMRYRRRINEQFESMFEAAAQQELQAILASMLGRGPSQTKPVSNDTIAIFLSWAIFGSLLEASRVPEGAARDSFVMSLVSICENLVA